MRSWCYCARLLFRKRRPYRIDFASSFAVVARITRLPSYRTHCALILFRSCSLCLKKKNFCTYCRLAGLLACLSLPTYFSVYAWETVSPPLPSTATLIELQWRQEDWCWHGRGWGWGALFSSYSFLSAPLSSLSLSREGTN